MDKKLFPRKANELDILIRNVKDKRPLAMDLLVVYLNNFILKELLYLLMENKESLGELMDEKYDFYWNRELLNLCISDESEEPFYFKLPSHISSLEFLIGYTLFADFLTDTEEEQEEEQLPYLFSLTTIFHSYHFLEVSCMLLIYSLHAVDQKINEEQLTRYLNTLTQEAHYHQTPGYLLLARLYFHLALIKKEEIAKISVDESNAMTNKERAVLANQEMDVLTHRMITYLELAELLEEESGNEIHNAYLGESIARSNLFSLDNISDLKKRYISELSFDYIPLTCQTLFALVSNEQNNRNVQLAQSKQRRAQLLQVPVVNPALLQQGRNEYFETPLLTAARHGDLSKFKKIIATGDVEWEEIDKNGNTTLHLAVLSEAYPLVKFILNTNSSLLAVRNNCGDRALDLTHDLKMQDLLCNAFEPKTKSTTKEINAILQPYIRFFSGVNLLSPTNKEDKDRQPRDSEDSNESKESKESKPRI